MKDFVSISTICQSQPRRRFEDLYNCLSAKSLTRIYCLKQVKPVKKSTSLMRAWRKSFLIKGIKFIMRFFPKHFGFSAQWFEAYRPSRGPEIMALEKTSVIYLPEDWFGNIARNITVWNRIWKLLSILYYQYDETHKWDAGKKNATERYDHFLRTTASFFQRSVWASCKLSCCCC